MQLARAINPSLTIGPLDTAPSVLAPLLAAAQEINVAEPGSEPDVRQAPVPEDLTLLGSFMADGSGTLPGLGGHPRTHPGIGAHDGMRGAQRQQALRGHAEREDLGLPGWQPVSPARHSTCGKGWRC